MNLFDLIAILFVALAASDVLSLARKDQARRERVARIIAAATLTIAALLIYKQWFDIPLLVCVAVIVVACQTLLAYEAFARIRAFKKQ